MIELKFHKTELKEIELALLTSIHANTQNQTIVNAWKKVSKALHKQAVSVSYCKPPNITYCKQAIYPDYDCKQCKWLKTI